MGRIKKLTVQNFKSVKDPVEIVFPEGVPVILVGENNSGKSNMVRALDLLLGEIWPGSYDPDDHDFHGRDKRNVPLEIVADLQDVTRADRYGRVYRINQLIIRYPTDDGRPLRMLEDGRESVYVSNEVRDQCLCVAIGADRRLAYQLSYSSKYTFLSKLMRQFHGVLRADPSRVEKLKNTFDQIKALFDGVGAFAGFTDELQKQMDDFSGNLEYCLKVDFSAYDPSNYFHSLRVFPYEGDEVRAFEELGTGQEQILAICFAYAYAKAFRAAQQGLVVVIEEPEAHLHPLAQKWVGRKIKELAAQGIQVVVTTHSPAFLDVMSLEGLALIRKREGSTEAIQLNRKALTGYCKDHGAIKANEDSVLPFYAAAATEEILAGLLARGIILVEGSTEALAIPVYLGRVGVEVTKAGVAVIPVHGVGNLAKWWRLFTAYEIPVYTIFDNDAGDDGAGAKRTELLRTLSLSSQRIAELLKEDSWLIGDYFCVFGANFEKTLRSYFGEEYVTLEREAQDTYGLSLEQGKPLVARYVAERLRHDEDSDGWKRFKALAQRIQAAATPA